MQPDQLGREKYIQYIFTNKFQRQLHFAAEVIFKETQNVLETCFDRQPEGAVTHDVYS